MSHFSVMIIGSNVDEQMERYSENLEVPEYSRVLPEDEKEDMLKYYREMGKISDDATFDECYEQFGEEWNGGSWRKDDDGVWNIYSTYNPESKWDWYVEGGRWGGFIHHFKDSIKEILDEDDYTIDENGKLCILKEINAVPKKYIDFDAMRKEDEEKAQERYLTVEKGIGKELLQEAISAGTFKSWSALAADCVKKSDYDSVREVYHAQPICKAWKKFSKENDDYAFGRVDSFVKPMDEYVKEAGDNAIMTFAIVKDGEWYERGEMGWWACVSNEKPKNEWNALFHKILDSADDEELITIVDCHI